MAQKNEIYSKILDIFTSYFGWKKILEIKNKQPAIVFARKNKSTGKIEQAIVPKEANNKETILQTLCFALSGAISPKKRATIIKSLRGKELNENIINTIVAFATNKASKAKASLQKIKKETEQSTIDNNGLKNPTI